MRKKKEKKHDANDGTGIDRDDERIILQGNRPGSRASDFCVKGQQLDYDAEKWNDYFLSLEEKRVEQYAVGVYLSAAMLSSIAAYGVLQKLKYRHSFPLAAAMFLDTRSRVGIVGRQRAGNT